MVQRAGKKRRAKGPHAAWQKSYNEIQSQLTAELYKASQHAEVKEAFAAAVTIFRYWWDHASDDEFPLVPESPYMRELVALIQQHAPDLADVYGANIYKFLLQGIFWACRIPWPTEWGIGRRKLGPGRHLIHEGGHYDGLEAVATKEFYEYKAYLRSETPPQKRGPKKEFAESQQQKPTKPRPPGPRSIDSALAMQAYTLHEDGYGYAKIAEQIWPDDPYHVKRRRNPRYHNKQDRDRLYHLVKRHVENGELQVNAKKGDAQI